MLCQRTSSKLGTVETDEEKAFHDLFQRSKGPKCKRRLRAGSQMTKKKVRVRCKINTMTPMVNTTLTPILGKRRCIRSHVLQSVKDLVNVVAAINTHGSVKVIMNPAGGNIVATQREMAESKRHKRP